MVPKNVGGLDRKLRLFVGGKLATTGLFALVVEPIVGVTVAAMALAGGGTLLFNVASQRCLANYLLGIDTCSGTTDTETEESSRSTGG